LTMEGSLLKVWGERARIFFVTHLVTMSLVLYVLHSGVPVSSNADLSRLLDSDRLSFRPGKPWNYGSYCEGEVGMKALKEIWTHFHWLIMGLGLFGIWAGGYFLVSSYMIDKPMNTLTTGLDEMIPFVPAFSFVYLTVYWMFLLAPFTSPTPRDSLLLARAYLTLIFVPWIFFIFYPVMFHRPDFDVNNFTMWTLLQIYRADNPINCFPSPHCAGAMLSTLIILDRSSRKLGLFAFVLTFVIGASTLLIKQHYILDVVAGYALGAGIYYFYYRMPSFEVQTYFRRVYQEIQQRIGQ